MLMCLLTLSQSEFGTSELFSLALLLFHIIYITVGAVAMAAVM